MNKTLDLLQRLSAAKEKPQGPSLEEALQLIEDSITEIATLYAVNGQLLGTIEVTSESLNELSEKLHAKVVQYIPED